MGSKWDKFWCREKVFVPDSKPLISFTGDENRTSETIINKASDKDKYGSELGNCRSAYLTVKSDFFCATGITIEVLNPELFRFILFRNENIHRDWKVLCRTVFGNKKQNCIILFHCFFVFKNSSALYFSETVFKQKHLSELFFETNNRTAYSCFIVFLFSKAALHNTFQKLFLNKNIRHEN